jgi:hypothetical protein
MKFVNYIIIIICFITISGCLNINFVNDYHITVMFCTNEENLNLSQFNLNNNTKLFNFKGAFQNGDADMILSFYFNNNVLDVVRDVEYMKIDNIKVNSEIYFEFTIYNINVTLSNSNIIGFNNTFKGSLSFNESESCKWNIDEEYNNTYFFYDWDDKTILIYLFPNNLNYVLPFYFSIYQIMN